MELCMSKYATTWSAAGPAAASKQCELPSLEHNSIAGLNIRNGLIHAKIVATAARVRRRLAGVRRRVVRAVCFSCAPCGRGAGHGMLVVALGSKCLRTEYLYYCTGIVFVCVALQMPLRTRLFSPLLALHSWQACACTAVRRAHINAI